MQHVFGDSGIAARWRSARERHLPYARSYVQPNVFYSSYLHLLVRSRVWRQRHAEKVINLTHIYVSLYIWRFLQPSHRIALSWKQVCDRWRWRWDLSHLFLVFANFFLLPSIIFSWMGVMQWSQDHEMVLHSTLILTAVPYLIPPIFGIFLKSGKSSSHTLSS